MTVVDAGGGTETDDSLATMGLPGENDEENRLRTSPKDNEELFTSLRWQKEDSIFCRE